MERPNAAGHGLGRRLCLERQDLSQFVQDGLRHYRHPLEWAQILRVARKPGEGGAVIHPGRSKQVRCPIYPRVSTDQGLEQDFNSLDAQYDASQAYIRGRLQRGQSNNVALTRPMRMEVA